MGERSRLTREEVDAFVAGHPGWRVDGQALVKNFSFRHYGAGIAFVVHVGFAAERRDHHPELVVSYGEVRVLFTTHDAGGITALDTQMAELADSLHLDP
jgi:4a-hydroxytetrahydrobiopterin dehydratase